MAATGPTELTYDCEGGVARITLGGDELHVLDRSAIAELDRLVARAESDGASVLVFAAEGTRFFSAGVSIEDHRADVVAETLSTFHAVFRRLYRAPFVSVAEVRGRALGGGCELALFCDVVVAADTARFALPEIDLACFPPIALSAFPYRFGRKAVELVLTGEPIRAHDALVAGLISHWVPRDELRGRVDELAQELAAKSPAVLGLTIRTLRSLWSPGFERALEDAERVYLDELVALPDYREGIEAFLGKRSPDFGGER